MASLSARIAPIMKISSRYSDLKALKKGGITFGYGSGIINLSDLIKD
jgi:hypothetical protein